MMDKRELYEKISKKILIDIMDKCGIENVMDDSVNILSVCLLSTITTCVKKKHWKDALQDIVDTLKDNMERTITALPGYNNE